MSPIASRDEFALPTIYQSYRSVESYLQLLAQNGPGAPLASAIAPIDALAFHLLVAMLPSRPILVDFAGADSHGASTVLCRCRTGARKVIAVRSDAASKVESWAPIVDEFTASLSDEENAPFTELTDAADLGRAIPAPSLVVMIIPTAGRSTEELTRELTPFLKQWRQVVVVLLSLGETGECDLVGSLAHAFGNQSPYRLALLRERAAAFHDCHLGLLFQRDHPAMDGILRRLRQVFTGNFSFLSMTKKVCEAAIQASQDNREGSITPLGQARQLLALRDLELALIRNSLAFQLTRRLKNVRRILAPDNSLQYRVYHKAIRLVQVLKSHGVRGVLSRLRRKMTARG